MERQKRLLKLLKLTISEIESREWEMGRFNSGFTDVDLRSQIKQLKNRYNRLLTKLERF